MLYAPPAIALGALLGGSWRAQARLRELLPPSARRCRAATSLTEGGKLLPPSARRCRAPTSLTEGGKLLPPPLSGHLPHRGRQVPRPRDCPRREKSRPRQKPRAARIRTDTNGKSARPIRIARYTIWRRSRPFARALRACPVPRYAPHPSRGSGLHCEWWKDDAPR